MRFPQDNDMSIHHGSDWWTTWPSAQPYMFQRAQEGFMDYNIEGYYPYIAKNVLFKAEVNWEGYSDRTAWFRQFWFVPLVVCIGAWWLNKNITLQKEITVKPLLALYNASVAFMSAAIAWQFSAHIWLAFLLNTNFVDYIVCRAGSAQFNFSSSGLWVIGYLAMKMLVFLIDMIVAALRKRTVLKSYWVMQTLEILGLSLAVQYEAGRIVLMIFLLAVLDIVNYFCYLWEIIKSPPRVGREVMLYRIAICAAIVGCEIMHILNAGKEHCDDTRRLGMYLILIFGGYMILCVNLFRIRFYRPKNKSHANASNKKVKKNQ